MSHHYISNIETLSVKHGINIFNFIQEFGTVKTYRILQKMYNEVEEGSQEEEALYVGLEQVNLVRQQTGLSEFQFK
jgi:NACalpha-BTF3-like transcription factor